MSQDSKGLRVIVAGCGIAGLVAARFLREHHHVTVYERGGPTAATGGQGICIFSNGVRLLDQIGFDRKRAGAVAVTGYRSYDKNGNLKSDTEFDYRGRYGADTLSMKRSDFRDELFRLATAESEELGVAVHPVKAVFDNAVVDVDPEKGEVALADGNTDIGDVVIVADGIHSRLRNRVLNSTLYTPQRTGMTCFRVAISAKKAHEALGKLPHWWEPSTGQGRITLIEAEDGTPRFIASYALRDFDYVNISCNFSTNQNRNTATQSWYDDADRDELLERFADYSPETVKLLSVADEVKTWDLQDLDPLPTFVSGRAILIGDAAHAMSVLQGQGANMAVEDGESFRLFTPDTTTEEVPAVLRKIEGVRRPRTARVLQDTRAMAREMSGNERFSRMDFNMSYMGIEDALRAER